MSLFDDPCKLFRETGGNFPVLFNHIFLFGWIVNKVEKLKLRKLKWSALSR